MTSVASGPATAMAASGRTMLGRGPVGGETAHRPQRDSGDRVRERLSGVGVGQFVDEDRDGEQCCEDHGKQHGCHPRGTGGELRVPQHRDDPMPINAFHGTEISNPSSRKCHPPPAQRVGGRWSPPIVGARWPPPACADGRCRTTDVACGTWRRRHHRRRARRSSTCAVKLGDRPAASLSPSRAGDFMTCPLLYRFRSVDRLPEPPGPQAARGTLVHAVLERLFDLPAPERTLSAAGNSSRPRGRRWSPANRRCRACCSVTRGVGPLAGPRVHD